MIVDVREPAEHDIVAVEGAELVPLGSLLAGEVHLPRERDIVLFCKAGVRSERAARALLDAGYERVSHVPGGILAWIREVDPQTLLLTGLTRDGVYLVEGGEITAAVNNFRWNESPVDLLRRFSHASATIPSFSREWGDDYFSRTATPALRVPDFNMSSVSPAQ